MARSYDIYTGNGTKDDYTVNFPYILKAHVEVRLDGVLKTDGVDYNWSGSTIVIFTTPPASGVTILLQRKSSQATRLVDYVSGSGLPEEDLDNDSLQAFYIAQESLDTAEDSITLDANDNTWDGQSKRIKSIATPTASTDAVTKAYVDAISVAAGNVPTPNNPADDNKVIRATGGTYGWYAFLIDWLSDAAAFMKTFLKSADVATARTNLGATSVGANVFTAVDDAAARSAIGMPAQFKAQISGLVPAIGIDTQHDLDITPGVALADSGTHFIKLASTITKQFDATWAVGTNAGGMASGESLPSSGTIHVWLIRRSDTGVVDVMANNHAVSGLSPTLPTNYDSKARIFSVRTGAAANLIGFSATEIAGGGLRVEWNSGQTDRTSTATGATAVSLTVPNGIVVRPRLWLQVTAAASGSDSVVDMGDGGTTAADWAMVYTHDIGQQQRARMDGTLVTNTLGQVYWNLATNSPDQVNLETMGYYDDRR